MLLKVFDKVLAVGLVLMGLLYGASAYVKFFIKDDHVTLREKKIAEGESLYDVQNCRTCHGSTNEAPLNSNYPKILGQNAAYVLGQLKDFKSGARRNGMSTVMQDAAGALNEEEMEKIALYLEAESGL